MKGLTSCHVARTSSFSSSLEAQRRDAPAVLFAVRMLGWRQDELQRVDVCAEGGSFRSCKHRVHWSPLVAMRREASLSSFGFPTLARPSHSFSCRCHAALFVSALQEDAELCSITNLFRQWKALLLDPFHAPLSICCPGRS